MLVRWTTGAAEDLARITDYLFDETPQHAARIIRSLYSAISALRSFPNRGRPDKNLRRVSWWFGLFLISWCIRSAAMLCMSLEFCTEHKSGRNNLP